MAAQPQTKPIYLCCEFMLLSSTSTVTIYYYYSIRKSILIHCSGLNRPSDYRVRVILNPAIRHDAARPLQSVYSDEHCPGTTVKFPRLFVAFLYTLCYPRHVHIIVSRATSTLRMSLHIPQSVHDDFTSSKSLKTCDTRRLSNSLLSTSVVTNRKVSNINGVL